MHAQVCTYTHTAKKHMNCKSISIHLYKQVVFYLQSNTLKKIPYKRWLRCSEENIGNVGVCPLGLFTLNNIIL